MNASGKSVWFVGDLDDPCAARLADGLPAGTARLPWAEDWAATLPAVWPAGATLVVYRSVLTTQDVDRLARLRKDRSAPPRVILCYGPYGRYAELERCALHADVVLSEASALETIARHLAPNAGRSEPRLTGPRPRVAVVSSNHELREALADACEAAGFPVQRGLDRLDPAGGGLAVWDVPVLDPQWPRTLQRRVRQAPVVALIGFADRELAAQARELGASACLELPCDPADLVEVLDRLSAVRAEPGHDVPPAPVVRRRAGRAVVEPGREAYN